jgi:hypothetical protein
MDKFYNLLIVPARIKRVKAAEDPVKPPLVFFETIPSLPMIPWDKLAELQSHPECLACEAGISRCKR